MRKKRYFDLIIASSLLIISIPMFIVIIVVIYVNRGFPVFFFQKRIGQFGIPFTIIKFQTMYNNNKTDKLGSFLRKYGLDELPQLINVIVGNMSLVGPRPLIKNDFNRVINAKRLSMPPGITGWAQINGRNSINDKEKFALDRWYINNRSTSLDVKILILTIPIILTKLDLRVKKAIFLFIFYFMRFSYLGVSLDYL